MIAIPATRGLDRNPGSRVLCCRQAIRRCWKLSRSAAADAWHLLYWGNQVAERLGNCAHRTWIVDVWQRHRKVIDWVVGRLDSPVFSQEPSFQDGYFEMSLAVWQGGCREVGGEKFCWEGSSRRVLGTRQQKGGGDGEYRGSAAACPGGCERLEKWMPGKVFLVLTTADPIDWAARIMLPKVNQ